MPLFLRLLIKHKIDAYALKSLDVTVVTVQVRSQAPSEREKFTKFPPFCYLWEVIGK